MKLSLPLHVIIPRKKSAGKKWILNLNTYRNTHFRILDEVKKLYTGVVEKILRDTFGHVPRLTPGEYLLTYTLFPASARTVDVMNPCSIIDKFTADALVELGVIVDDNFRFIPEVRSRFGGFDKANPRCELEITPFCSE